MSKAFRVMALSLVVSGSAIAGANAAAVVFSDNFNSDAYQLDWTPPASLWTVPRDRSVGLIGETTTLTASNFDPGNGGYVDLGGSTGAVRTSMDFARGNLHPVVRAWRQYAGRRRGEDEDPGRRLVHGGYSLLRPTR